MAYGLPVKGQANYDDELNNSIESVRSDAALAKSTADAANTSANTAKTDATTAVATANQALDFVRTTSDDRVAEHVNDSTSATRAALSATYGRLGAANDWTLANNFHSSTYAARLRVRNDEGDGSQAGLLVTDVPEDGWDRAKRLLGVSSVRAITNSCSVLLAKVAQTAAAPVISIFGIEGEAGTHTTLGAIVQRLIGVGGYARHRSNTTIPTAVGLYGAVQGDTATGTITEARAIHAARPAKFAGALDNLGTHHGLYVAGDGDTDWDSSTTLLVPTNWYGMTLRRPPAVSGERLAAMLEHTARIKTAAGTDAALQVMADADSNPVLTIRGDGSVVSPETDRVHLPVDRFMVYTLGAPSMTNVSGVPAWALDAAVDERVVGQVRLPAHWLTYTVDVHWTAAAGAGNVRWRVDEKFIGDGDTMGMTAAVGWTLGAAPAANTQATTTAATGRTVTAGKVLTLAIARAGSDASDTMAGDAYLLGVTLRRAS